MRIGDRQELTVRAVTNDDVHAVAAVAARAFEDDAAFQWFMPNDRTRLTRLKRLTMLFELFSGSQLNVDFADMSTTTDLAGLCTWLGPDHWEPPTRKMLGPIVRLFFRLGPRSFMKIVAAMGEMKKNHPKTPHWYLLTLATDPPRQRTGVGTALLRPGLARCDAMRLGAYLETQKVENVAYYARFGFRVMKEIDLPMKGPHLWLMWRDPQ